MVNNFDLSDSFEKIPTKIFNSPAQGSRFVAERIRDLINTKNASGEKTVLGLATGSTPEKLYGELIRMHRQEGLSFKNVIAFNLDEYFPVSSESKNSYRQFMKKQLFDAIDIDPNNCHIPSGSIAKEEITKHTEEYENRIKEAGGIDLQILGIGNNGHIGFNEPGSADSSRTRLITLDNTTRIANSRNYENISQVPRLALTMGMQTIMEAKEIILMAWGEAKADAVKKSVEGDLTEQVPASLLQNHPNCLFVIDQFAAEELTRFKAPWLAGNIEWTPQLMKTAVIKMALELDKPVLFLTDQDYYQYGLGDLMVEKGSAYEVNLQVFYMLRDSITGWPGGKPNANIPNHPERSEPYPKKVVIFSPHPDDDIISMGGTFMRLHDQGHDVHVAYQTSGNIAVTDEFVTRFLDFAVGFESIFHIDNTISKNLYNKAVEFLAQKKSLEKDTPEIREIKGLIRRCEAKATCKYVGIPDENIHFQNLPFYETGTVQKNPMGPEDVKLTVELLRQIKPQQIYCAGDLADPHGTHKVCLDVVLTALEQIKSEPGGEWLDDCYVWLYKGAWQEWSIDQIEMAIPMSPEQVRKKRYGIFIHQSQKDSVPFQGADAREFWQRAEERNANTADLYAKLGLTRYAAMEAFVRLKM